MEEDHFKGTIYDFSIRDKLRGAWLVLLCNTAGVGSANEQAVVCKQIRRLCEYFPCLECKGHFEKYLRMFPPEDKIGISVGLFNWTIDFMNSICRRLGKEEYQHYILYKIFHEVGYGVCDKNC